jgi:hypothetical protein
MKHVLKIDKHFTEKEIEMLKESIQNNPTGFLIPMENVIKELKHKKEIPTVIEYKGRRYILDHADNRK